MQIRALFLLALCLFVSVPLRGNPPDENQHGPPRPPITPTAPISESDNSDNNVEPSSSRAEEPTPTPENSIMSSIDVTFVRPSVPTPPLIPAIVATVGTAIAAPFVAAANSLASLSNAATRNEVVSNREENSPPIVSQNIPMALPASQLPPARRDRFRRSDFMRSSEGESHPISRMGDLPGPLAMFLDGLLGIVNFRNPETGAIVQTRREPALRPEAQVRYLMGLASMILKVYTYKLYEGPPIETMAQYFQVTRGYIGSSGSHRIDWRNIRELIETSISNPTALPHAYRLAPPTDENSLGSFANIDIKTEAALYEMGAVNHMTSLMTTATSTELSDAGRHRSIMRVVWDGFGKFVTSYPGNFSAGIRMLVNAADNMPNPTPQINQPRNTRDWLLGLADVVDNVTNIQNTEVRFLQGLQKLMGMSHNPAQIVPLIQASEDAINLVYAEFLHVGSRLAQSPQLAMIARRDPRAFQMLRTLFNSYPEALPPSVFRNIAAKLFRMPFNLSDFAVFQVMCTDFDPVFLNILQQASHTTTGEMQEVFRMLQEAARIPMANHLAEMILERDPSRYFRRGLAELIYQATGKSFAVFEGTFPGEKNRVIEVGARIRHPDVPEMMRIGADISPRLVPILSPFVFPNILDEGERNGRMQRLVDVALRRISLEGDVWETSSRQQRMHLELSRTVDAPTVSGQRIPIVIEVAPVIPLERGTEDQPNEVMVYHWASNRRSWGEYQRTNSLENRQAALYGILYSHIENFFFEPMFGRNGGQPQEDGIAHEDTHAGNVLKLEGNRFRIIDFGRTTCFTRGQLEDITLLTIAARYGDSFLVTEMLWNLRNAQGRQQKTKEELSRVIRQQMSALLSSRSFWGPGQWVMFAFINGLIDFPDDLLGLDGSTRALQNFAEEGLGLKPADMDRVTQKVTEDLTNKYYENLKTLLQTRGFGGRSWLHRKWRGMLSYCGRALDQLAPNPIDVVIR